MPSITVVIPWRDRPELLDTLRHNARCFHAIDAEVMVVNCGGDIASFPWAEVGNFGARVSRIDLDMPVFNKGFAINHGVAQSTARHVFLLDADILLAVDTLGDMQSALSEDNFVTVASVQETSCQRLAEPPELHVTKVVHWVEFIMANGMRHRIATNTLDLAEGARAGPGLILLRRADFLAIGGMKSTLSGWGWDDIDLIVRLQIARGLERLEAGAVRHVSHDNSKRSVLHRGRGESESQNFMKCVSDYALGDLFGTFEADTTECRISLRKAFFNPVS